MKAETKTKTADGDMTEYNLVLKKNFASQRSKIKAKILLYYFFSNQFLT